MSFEADISDIMDMIEVAGEEELVKEVSKISLKLVREFSKLNPVDSGLMRSSWEVNRNSLSPQIESKLKMRGKGKVKFPNDANGKARVEVKHIRSTDKRVYIQNRVDYADTVLNKHHTGLFNKALRQALK